MRLRGIRLMGAAGREARKASMQAPLNLAMLTAGAGTKGIGTGNAIETMAGTAGGETAVELLLWRPRLLNDWLGGGPESDVPWDSGTASE